MCATKGIKARYVPRTFEVSASDIPQAGYISRPSETIYVKENNLKKAEIQRLNSIDIVLAIKGSVGKVGIVPEKLEGKWIANQSFQIIRLRKDSAICDPRVLYMYLKSYVAQDLLRYRSYGATIPMVQKRDVVKFPVIVPSPEQQQETIEFFEEEVRLMAKIKILEAKIRKLNEAYWEPEY